MDDIALLDFEESYPSCPSCEQELDWSDCDLCGGEGEGDAYEIDPLWYSPFDTEICPQCGGAGGWYVCGNQQCDMIEVTV